MPTFRRFTLPAPAIAAGIVSAVFSGLIENGFLTGLLIVPLLPIIPLMITGFAFGVVGLSGACLVALVLTPLVAGLSGGLVILALQIFPAWLFTRELLKARVDFERERILWAPPGAAFTAVALYAALFVMLMYGLSPQQFTHSLGAFQQEWAAMATQMDPQSAAAIKAMGPGLQQGLLVFIVWMLVFLLYACACLANFCVLAYRFSLRPSLRLVPYTPRGVVLVVMAAAALIGLLGPGGPDGLTDMARIVCLLLLLPYFVSGLSSIHAALARWQHPAVWQVGFYLLVFGTLWPALPIALYGIVRQVSRLTAHTSAA